MNSCPPHLHLDQQLCFALYSSSLAMTKAYKPELSALGLTYPQYLVMCALWQSPATPLSLSGLGEQLMLDSGTLTPMLKRMQALGLITRQRAQHDERVVWVLPTAKGMALQDRVAQVPQQLACRLSLSESQRLALIAQLQHLRDALNLSQPPA